MRRQVVKCSSHLSYRKIEVPDEALTMVVEMRIQDHPMAIAGEKRVVGGRLWRNHCFAKAQACSCPANTCSEHQTLRTEWRGVSL